LPRDAYGYQLNYFTGDYKAVNTSRNPFPGHSAYIGAAYRPLYNGNISSMGVNIGKLNQLEISREQTPLLHFSLTPEIAIKMGSVKNEEMGSVYAECPTYPNNVGLFRLYL